MESNGDHMAYIIYIPIIVNMVIDDGYSVQNDVIWIQYFKGSTIIRYFGRNSSVWLDKINYALCFQNKIDFIRDFDVLFVIARRKTDSSVFIFLISTSS